jgi:hypothetical protein
MPTPRPPSKRLAVLEDDHLLQQASTGDQRAFERLVERHGPWLLHLICRMVRDEHLAQDILNRCGCNCVAPCRPYAQKGPSRRG